MHNEEHYQQHLTITAMEEAGELIQELAKLLRFGENEQVRDRIITEYSDLVALMDKLGYTVDSNRKIQKMHKVNYYYEQVLIEQSTSD